MLQAKQPNINNYSTMQSDRKSIAVLDANAFISMSNIRNLSATCRMVTTEDVLGELKDLKTKQFVETLPFEIETIDCDDKALQLVKEFAKKTGDIASLSQVDMELIAITYMLYKKEGLGQSLRKQPPAIHEKEDLLEIAEQGQLSATEYSDEEDEQETKDQNIVNSNKALEKKQEQKQNQQTKAEVLQKTQANQKQAIQEDEGWTVVPAKPKRKVSSSSSESDDEEGWITTKNYEKKMAEMTSTFKAEVQQEEQPFNIWLVSADFALQNVAVQMGMKLLSVDGRKITSIRRFIYECYLCWKKFRIHDEKVRICNNCGYNSLSKIAYSIDQKGYMILHRKKGWKPNKKILEVKQRKFEEQQRNKKHQHARRKKKPSIFEN